MRTHRGKMNDHRHRRMITRISHHRLMNENHDGTHLRLNRRASHIRRIFMGIQQMQHHIVVLLQDIIQQDPAPNLEDTILIHRIIDITLKNNHLIGTFLKSMMTTVCHLRTLRNHVGSILRMLVPKLPKNLPTRQGSLRKGILPCFARPPNFTMREALE